MSVLPQLKTDSTTENKLEQMLELSMLYDFYGALLNQEKQQVLEDYVLNNLSISEIASEKGISRQAVHDMVKRCTAKLYEYEKKLMLVQKFYKIKEEIQEIQEEVNLFRKTEQRQCIDKIEDLSKKILEEL